MLNRKYCVFIIYIQNVQVRYTKKHTFLQQFYRERWLLSQSHSVSSKDIHHAFFLLTLTPACLFLISVLTVVFCMVSRSSASVLYPQLGHCTSITLISFILSGLSVTTTSVRFPSLSRQASIAVEHLNVRTRYFYIFIAIETARVLHQQMWLLFLSFMGNE